MVSEISSTKASPRWTTRCATRPRSGWHDAVIGEDCEIAPHTSVGGHVELGDGVRVGQGAVFRPFVKVGEGARIGAGAVVVRDVPANEVWVGKPAGPMRTKSAA